MSDLHALIQKSAEKTESILDELLDKEAGLSAPVFEAARYSSLMGGKRLRPFLVKQSCSLFDVEEKTSLRVGAALEMIHTYSLIHDDLPAMDDSDLRRGKPSCHKAFDEVTAILAGDGLLTYAFEVLSDQETHQDPAIRCELVRELAVAAGMHGMVGGQMMDIAAEEKSLTYQDIKVLQDKKTGALFRFALLSGAIIAGKDDQIKSALGQYAEAFGLIFQITDDLLDVEGNADQMGKPVGQDPDKITFVTLLGVEGAKKELQALEKKALEAICLFENKSEYLRLLLQYVISRRN